MTFDTAQFALDGASTNVIHIKLAAPLTNIQHHGGFVSYQSAFGADYNTLSLGNGAFALGSNSTSVGSSSSAWGDYTLAVGHSASVAQWRTNSIAIGTYANADGTNSMALGAYAWASNNNSIVIGTETQSVFTVAPVHIASDVTVSNLTSTNFIIGQNLTASRVLLSGADKDITNSTVTATEIGYVSGVTSAIQTQMDTKAALGDPWAANKLVGSVSGGLVTINVTTNEAAYLSGVTSAIQTQIDTKLLSSSGTATDLSLKGAIIYKEPDSGLVTLAGANQVPTNSPMVHVVGDGTAVTLTSTPNIPPGANGQMLIIIGNSVANTVTLQDETHLVGSGLALNINSNRTIGDRDVLTLIYSTRNSAWQEVSFSENSNP